MNKLLAFLLILACASCSSDEIIDNLVVERAPEVPSVSEYHEKFRTKPYPIAESTIFVNPAPLIVPQSMKTGEFLQFQLSQDSTFSSTSTITSEKQAWCMYSPHKVLAPGEWFWRVRNDEGAWGDIYRFTVTGSEEEFATPSFNVFTANAPRRHPRLNCFADANADSYRENAPSHPEYRMMTARAESALQYPTDDTGVIYGDYTSLRNNVMWLSDAYVLTHDERYASKLTSILETIVASPASDAQLFTENFATSAITYAYTAIYDLLYNRLSPDLRQGAERQMLRALKRFAAQNIGYQENHIFDNHFWQQNMRIMFQTAFCLYDKPEYSAQVTPILQYYYELWCTRAPATGFSRDGLWHNGVGYMSANVLTLAYMPKLLSYITRFDFLSHPWYKAAGRSLCYSCPTGSMGVGFGDESERYATTNRLYPAFADFLAAETGDGFAGWYAGQNRQLIRSDYELRLMRMTRSEVTPYPTETPAGATAMTWYSDAGEVAMHSNLGDTPYDLALAFRSSGFGSGSHTTSSQNAFNLYYGGKPILHSSGYYQNFSDAHNLMSYRHSRAHNTILVNGIGQPYTTRAYGSMVRVGGGSSISYALGDASNAYCGVTDDPMWLQAFADAGITQTPDNGFGTTPLTRYRRHLTMLQGNIVVIYDELEASEAARWDWLLHSDTPFDISDSGVEGAVANNLSETIVTVFSGVPMSVSQTDRFAVPPAIQDERYPNQWHFSAIADGVAKLRVLAIIRTAAKGDRLPSLKKDADVFQVGDWTISARLDADRPASLEISNRRTGSGLSFGSDDFATGGKIYHRNYLNSTIIVDRKDGSLKATELVDVIPPNSRSAQ